METKVCLNCGTTYMPSESKRKYCSRRCASAAKENSEIRICLTCKQEFTVKPCATKKYCSVPCFAARDRSATRKQYPMRVCVVCGKEFAYKRTDNTGKYCSHACFNKSDPNAARRQPRIKKICPGCGKEFMALPYGLGNKTHCSKKCANVETAKTQVGKAHPLYKEKTEMACKVCGKVCQVKPSLVERFSACSRACAAVLSIQAQNHRTSSIEVALYGALVEAGLMPVKQHVIAPYTIDLAFPEHALAVECDGDYWHSTPWQIKKDERRDSYLGRKGWRTLRIKETQIKTDIAACVALVIAALS